MAFLTTFCDQCQRVALLEEKGWAADQMACTTCEGFARILPGCSFASGDKVLVEDVSQVIAEGKLSAGEAQAMAHGIERELWKGVSAHLLDSLATRLPGLVLVAESGGNIPSGQRRVLLLLKTILDAIAMNRRTTRPPAREAP